MPGSSNDLADSSATDSPRPPGSVKSAAAGTLIADPKAAVPDAPSDPAERPWRRPSGADLAAGVTAGLFSVPEGMAYAAVGGFSPAAGLYAEVGPAILGSLLTPAVLMITTLTSAIAVTSGTTVLHAHLNPADPAVVSALALTVGLGMLLFGLAGAGKLLRRIPPAALAGFSAGIAAQILAGGLAEATGYKADATHGQAWRLEQWAWHATHWSTTSTQVAAVTVGIWGLIAVFRRARRVALLVALLLVSVAVAVLHAKVPLASSLGKIPHGLPVPVAPTWSDIPRLAPGAAVIALVALAQAGGITTPQDPDGVKARSLRSILAQALANLSGVFVNAMPVGGSMSRTGVVVAAGARSRWAGLASGATLALLVTTAGPMIARIPVPLIGGLIAVVGCQLFAGRVRQVRRLSTGAGGNVLVFLAMLGLTMQETPLVAVVLCVALALVPMALRTWMNDKTKGLSATVTPSGRAPIVPVPVPSPTTAAVPAVAAAEKD